MSMNLPNKAIFLDRDGTINEGPPYINRIDQLDILPESFEGLRLLGGLGFKLIIITNQSGIARQYLSEKTLKTIHKHLLAEFKKRKIKIHDIFFCPHHPDEKCRCRKPQTLMIKKATLQHKIDLKSSYMIGDNECDIELGQKTGLKTILVLTGLGKKTRKNKSLKPHYVAKHLLDAAKWIKGTSKKTVSFREDN